MILKKRESGNLSEKVKIWDFITMGKSYSLLQYRGITWYKLNKTIPDNMLAFPIPQIELNTPGGKVVQNPGY